MPQLQQIVYSVPGLNQAVRESILSCVGSRGRVLVGGEIGQVKVMKLANGGGMAFFNLHEGDEFLSCVSYGREYSQLVSLDTRTGEVFDPPRDIRTVLVQGRKVICEGQLTTYARKGQSLYQLLVRSVTDRGAGERERLLQELKKKLNALGYFDEKRKRKIPLNPARIALVTSRDGAAIHDFLRTAQELGLGFRARLHHVRVQGDGAGIEMARAVREAGLDGKSQVVVLIRGGGSAEDLAEFNDETLARAVFESPVPVLAGVGHETDFTFADLTADARASTPTKAAQMLFTPRQEFFDSVAAERARVDRAMGLVFRNFENQVAQTERMLKALGPDKRRQEGEREVRELSLRLSSAFDRYLKAREERVWEIAQGARRAMQVRADMDARAMDVLADRLLKRGRFHLDAKTMQHAAVSRNLVRAGQGYLALLEQDLEKVSLRLAAASPLAPLERGFALVRGEDGRIVRSVNSVWAGSVVSMQVADGTITAVVDKVVPSPVKGRP